MEKNNPKFPKCGNFSNIPMEMQYELENICSELSPENLSCDGGSSRGEIARKIQKLEKEWEEIEEKIQMKVDRFEFECFSFSREVSLTTEQYAEEVKKRVEYFERKIHK